MRRGGGNGVEGLKMLEGFEALRMESQLQCVKAIFSPVSGIVDSHSLMLSLAVCYLIQPVFVVLWCDYLCLVVAVILSCDGILTGITTQFGWFREKLKVIEQPSLIILLSLVAILREIISTYMLLEAKISKIGMERLHCAQK
uniref:Uncharacterized protein n=1 Tax=Rhizophora mucronata TaxID=61149 RepID=A0A2P2KFP0_RHIMU